MYGYNRWNTGYYRNNFYSNRGYYGYPQRYYGNRYWKREAEAEATAVAAPEADAEAQGYYGYGYWPRTSYGMGYYGYPRSYNYGRFWKRDAEADAAAEAYNYYRMNRFGNNFGRSYGYRTYTPYSSTYYNRMW